MPQRAKHYRHKVLLDEGLYQRKFLLRTNSRHNLRHIKHDLNRGGIKDEEVHEIAAQQKRIIVTYNINDFKKLATKNKDCGVIGVTQGMSIEQLDKKLSALLNRSTTKSLYNKYTSLGLGAKEQIQQEMSYKTKS